MTQRPELFRCLGATIDPAKVRILAGRWRYCGPRQSGSLRVSVWGEAWWCPVWGDVYLGEECPF